MEDLARHGIEPVPSEARRLTTWDLAVLWGDLGIGLLVLLTGSFLVPALSLGQALAAIVAGSAVGVALLGLTAMIGSQTGAPTMVCLRPALGLRGSYLPTALNVVQLLGWTVFELVIMGYAANAVSRRLLGLDAYGLWVTAFAAVVVLMGVWGPLGVVRQWLARFAVWVVLATTVWLTFVLLARYDARALLARPGQGGLPFGTALDIVIAMPISWLPLVCDYSRFARRRAPAFWGTALGYFVANVWFYALGALVLLAAGVTQEPTGFVEAVALLAGPLTLLVLLVDETDEAWADLYSCAVSVQNGFPAAPLRPLVLGLGAVAWAVALVLDVTRYETFLLLIGSVFVPLFGVLAADYFLLRGRYEPAELLRADGLYARPGGLSWPGLAAWAVGVAAYQAVSGNLAGLGWGGAPWLGASLPSLAVGGLVYLGLAGGAASLAGRGRPGPGSSAPAGRPDEDRAGRGGRHSASWKMTPSV